MDAVGGRTSEATAAAGRILGKLCEVFYTTHGTDDDKPSSADAKAAP